MSEAWTAPASDLQRGWVQSADGQGLSNYNEAVGWTIAGEVDAGAMVEALDAMARRHDALRTALVAADGDVVQEVSGEVELEVARVDLADVAAPADELGQVLLAEAGRPFALARAPLWRAAIVRLGSSRTAVSMTCHHAIFDAWSAGVAWEELVCLYEAIVMNRRPRLPAMEIQFGDFAAWQRDYADADLESRWRERFARPSQRPSLPTRPGARTLDGFHLVSREFPAVAPAAARRLASLGQEHGASPATTVYAAVAATVSEYVDHDLVLGLLYANREDLAVQPLIGPVFDYLPLRIDVSRQQSYRELLDHVREELHRAKERWLPLGRIEAAVGGPDSAGGRLFDVSVNFARFSAAPARRLALRDDRAVEFGAMSVRTDLLELKGVSRFAAAVPLSYVVTESEEGGWSGWIFADRRVFSDRTIARLGGEFSYLLQALGSWPDRAIVDVRLAGPR